MTSYYQLKYSAFEDKNDFASPPVKALEFEVAIIYEHKNAGAGPQPPETNEVWERSLQPCGDF